ncbi:MAG: hypothetical protein ACK5GG_07620 [Betaproteobacteria bacterium]
MDQIRDLGFWRQYGARLRRLRERQHLSLRQCARLMGASAEDLLNVEVGNIFAFIHSGKVDANLFESYERYLLRSQVQEAEVNGPRFGLTYKIDRLAHDATPPLFLKAG